MCNPAGVTEPVTMRDISGVGPRHSVPCPAPVSGADHIPAPTPAPPRSPHHPSDVAPARSVAGHPPAGRPRRYDLGARLVTSMQVEAGSPGPTPVDGGAIR